MCGILGYIGERKAAPLIVKALKRLEYRGYDSVGVATIADKLYIKKDKGEVEELEAKLKFSEMPGKVGLGHTRWATHGVPSQINAHPHTSCEGEIAVVHNGIIENYLELKQELLQKGHVFKSQTDTEVIAHLIEENLDEEFEKLEDAVLEAVKKLEGSFALVIVSNAEPDKIIAVRNKAPLVLGIGKNEMFVASDIPAFLNETRKAVILKNHEMVIITKNAFRLLNFYTEKELKPEIQEIKWSADAAEKGGYPYFALKEIKEIPEAVENTLAGLKEIEALSEKIKKFRKIFIVACGTSYHAALISKYLFEKNGIQAEAVLASEFPYGLVHLVDKNTLVIAISQSGETADTLTAVALAKENGAKILGIVNVIGSSIDRDSDFQLHTHAGPEIAVIATKTFVAQLAVLYALSMILAGKAPEVLKKIPKLQKETIEKFEIQVKEVADKLKDKEDVYFIGRGISYPLALEGALKLKEISYIHAEGMPAGELKHGSLSLISEGVAVVVIVNPESQSRIIGNIEEVRARKGFVIALSNEADAEIEKHADFVFNVPETSPELYPLLQILVLQLLAYYVTVMRGLNPDKPRNLAKCVTVE